MIRTSRRDFIIRATQGSLVLGGIALLAACGGTTAAPASGAASAPGSAPASNKPASSAPSSAAASPAAASGSAAAVELSFFFPVAVGGPITKIINSYAADFTKANPKIIVKPTFAGSYQDTLTKVQTTLDGGGTPPDTMVSLSTDLYTLQDAGYIIPLDDYINNSGGAKYAGDFFPSFMLNSKAGGKTYGIPFQRSTVVMYYNK
ncbi:MAG: extracellular solute-binding protein, partial [Chloroflexota bacterium]